MAFQLKPFLLFLKKLLSESKVFKSVNARKLVLILLFFLFQHLKNLILIVEKILLLMNFI